MRPATLFLLVLAATVPAASQAQLRFDQLRGMIESSIQQRLQDREIAKYLRDQKLAFRLTDAQVEDFVGMGIEGKTLEALRKLQLQSQSLPEADTAAAVKQQPRQPPPPSQEEQDRILAEARRNALDYTSRLPDFVCLQITRRHIDPSGLEMDWLKFDEIKTRVSYVDGHENYDLVSVNNQPSSKGILDIGGAASTGEFGSMLHELFDPSTQASFRWARHSLLRGRAVYVFHLRVTKQRSRWQLTFEKTNRIIPGYSGLVYIDKETERVLRVAMNAEGIPPAFPIREAGTRLDYDFIDIGGNEFLLPLKARVRSRQDRLLSRNDVEFRLYRKFSADATITFDEIDDLEPLPEEP